MPQLSPMMGFIMMASTIAVLAIFLISVSKSPASLVKSETSKIKTPSFIIFKFWNGSNNA